MILEKVYEEFGTTLPDRGDYRANPPVAFREVIKEYKSWGRFVTAYSNFVKSKENKLKPIKLTGKKVGTKKKTTLRR